MIALTIGSHLYRISHVIAQCSSNDLGRFVDGRLRIVARIETTPPRYLTFFQQNSYVERMNGSIRRDCLDDAGVLTERHLKRILAGYFSYYHRRRTRLSLEVDTANFRPVQ